MTNKNTKTMTILASTKENNAKVKALKIIQNTIGKIYWNGNTTHDTMDKCLRGICLYSGVNSGHYNPAATRINGLTGWFMINQDGSLFCEARVIKEDEKKYRIEYISMEGWNEFEKLYSDFVDEN